MENIAKKNTYWYNYYIKKGSDFVWNQKKKLLN